MDDSSTRDVALARVPLFSSFSTQELGFLEARVQHHSFQSGETIFQKDDPGMTLYMIISGLVRISLPSEDGLEIALAILTPGEFFGELSLLDGEPRSASAVAIEPTTTAALHREDFLDFLKTYPNAAMVVLTVLCARLRHTDSIVADAIFLDLPSRVAKKLLELADAFGHQVNDAVEIDLKLRQQDLASMVGATREAVNRALSALERRGILKVGKQKIIVLNPQALRDRILIL